MNDKKITKLFGTDGIRGTANTFPMLPDTVVRIGQAIGHILNQNKNHLASGVRRVVIGKDTRLSGYMIEQALASGLNSMGIYVHLVGPLPTPGIGYLTRTMRAMAGIVISASHNAFQDNGIKVFGPDGYKISEGMEREIERLVASEDLTKLLPPSRDVGRTRRIEDAQGRYIVFVKNTFPLEYTLDGIRIVLDTAHGAAYKVAPAVFEELGAEVIQLGNTPNGININDKVGALYPAKLSEAVIQYRADVGISFDGDADRVIMVDEKGEIVNGDHILGICALFLKQKSLLKKDTLVVTQMSNFGLEKKMKENGIKVVKTGVGDKYVVEEMRKNSYNLGGEQSGHIIFLDHTTTGDACIAALSVLAVLKESGKTMSELNDLIEDVPQVLINLRVRQRKELKDITGYDALISDIEKKLKNEGRVFVRFSGTEPVLRVLVEGPDKIQISEFAEQIAKLLEGTQLIRLGVNVDHVATLRQVRGGTTPYPDLLKLVKETVKGGAQQITIHLREDRRHIQLNDLALLSKKCPVLLNLEMGTTNEMLKYALRYRPDWVCLVPEKRQELTTEGGLNVSKAMKKIIPMIQALKKKNIRVSTFIEPSLEQVHASFDCGAKAVEFHTGHWVLLQGSKKQKEWDRLVNAAHLAHALGLGVHAGHGLDYQHARKIRKLPYLAEVNIGHSLVCYALEEGLRRATARMKKELS